MKTLIVILSFVSAFTVLQAQGNKIDYIEAPFSYVQDWVIFNTTPEQVKSDIPTGFTVALEDKERLILEKKIGVVLEEIVIMYNERNRVEGVKFTQSFDREDNLKEELIDLGYVLKMSAMEDEVETYSYKHPDKGYEAIILVSNNPKKISCTLQKPSEM